MNHKLSVLFSALILSNSVSAATLVDLKHQSADYLLRSNNIKFKEGHTDVDFNHVRHTRMQQTFAGYPVWNAEIVVHEPNGRQQRLAYSGAIYQGIEKDLAKSRAILSVQQKNKALAYAKSLIKQATQEESIKTIIFVDDKNVAHYAYLVSFYSDDGITGAHRPTFIIDAVSWNIYKQWDRVLNEGTVYAGGIGGNEKLGEVVYDGIKTPLLTMKHGFVVNSNGPGILCSLENEDIVVQDASYDNETVSTSCIKYNDHYWLSLDAGMHRWKKDEMNFAYSPSLDALYGATLVKNLFRDWYGIPALVKEDGETAMKMVMRVHYGRRFENAFWDGKQMTFGDGDTRFYPFTSVDVTAHEIGHGFTEQHSNIDYSLPQMGGLHESFSDMASAAINYYMTGKNTWRLAGDIVKNGDALRYMDEPRKDKRSIDHMKDYSPDINSHLLAGVTNKAFYLIATSPGWDTRKAFNVMVKANRHYWTSSMKTFEDAACGVISATKDYGYNVADVQMAFLKVGVETDKC